MRPVWDPSPETHFPMRVVWGPLLEGLGSWILGQIHYVDVVGSPFCLSLCIPYIISPRARGSLHSGFGGISGHSKSGPYLGTKYGP